MSMRTRGWRGQPREIAQATVVQAADRIAQHSALHRVPSTRVVMHGGEPLLLGPVRLREIADTLRTRIGPVSSLDLSIQTNGVRLDERFGEVFARHRIRIGVSLDGDQAANDRHRRFADGRSSYARVRSALALLRRPEYRHIYGGILCTIDLANDPIAVYEALLAEEPPRVDLLLPHATWEHPPPRHGETPAPYAGWLGRVYARWHSDGRPFDIRLFSSLESAARGGPSWSESVGLDPVNFVVIDTDGSWQQADSLRPPTMERRPPASASSPIPWTKWQLTPVSQRAAAARAICAMPGMPGGAHLRGRPLRPPVSGSHRF